MCSCVNCMFLIPLRFCCIAALYVCSFAVAIWLPLSEVVLVENSFFGLSPVVLCFWMVGIMPDDSLVLRSFFCWVSAVGCSVRLFLRLLGLLFISIIVWQVFFWSSIVFCKALFFPSCSSMIFFSSMVLASSEFLLCRSSIEDLPRITSVVWKLHVGYNLFPGKSSIILLIFFTLLVSSSLIMFQSIFWRLSSLIA